MKEYASSKIHKAIVTQADLHYVGSITIDEDLMDMTGIEDQQKVLVVDNTNGSRLETYVIKGERGSGIICMNGAAAHLIKKGDEVIIIGFTISDTPPKLQNILVDKDNKFVRNL